MPNLCECGCGKEIAETRRFVSGHNGKGPRKARISVKCTHCGSDIFMTAIQAQRRMSRSKTLFCNAACRDAFRRTRGSDEHPGYRRIRHKCAICGTLFLVVPSRFARGTGVYCSRVCGIEGRRRKMIGMHTKRAPGKSLAAVRRQAKERDNYRCRICGFREALHSHHIAPKSQGGKHDLANLITLCPNHHALVHAGLLKQTDLLKALKEPIHQKELKLSRKTHAIYYRRKLS